MPESIYWRTDYGIDQWKIHQKQKFRYLDKKKQQEENKNEEKDAKRNGMGLVVEK